MACPTTGIYPFLRIQECQLSAKTISKSLDIPVLHRSYILSFLLAVKTNGLLL